MSFNPKQIERVSHYCDRFVPLDSQNDQFVHFPKLYIFDLFRLRKDISPAMFLTSKIRAEFRCYNKAIDLRKSC